MLLFLIYDFQNPQIQNLDIQIQSSQQFIFYSDKSGCIYVAKHADVLTVAVPF